MVDGFEFVDLNITKPDPEAMELVPGDFALKQQILPMALDGGTLVVAMGAPQSLQAADDLGILINRPVIAVLADKNLIQERIQEFFLERILAGMTSDDSTITEIDDSTDLADLTKLAGETAVIQMVNGIFAQAVRDGASDIHIEPYEREVKIRVRVDGMLSDLMRPPKRMHAALISRIKILGEGMNIAERRLPQDGRIKQHRSHATDVAKPFGTPDELGDRVVRNEERGCRNNSGFQGSAAMHHARFDRTSQQDDDHQIEGGKLTQLATAQDSHRHGEKHIDCERASGDDR